MHERYRYLRVAAKVFDGKVAVTVNGNGRKHEAKIKKLGKRFIYVAPFATPVGRFRQEVITPPMPEQDAMNLL